MTLYHRRAFYTKVLVQLMKNSVKLTSFEKKHFCVDFLQKFGESTVLLNNVLL